MQKELAFTPVKYVTKQNPFKIIPLQPTRKENNWETEETFERTIVTPQTERAKWPNPGCFWSINIYLYFASYMFISTLSYIKSGYSYFDTFGIPSFKITRINNSSSIRLVNSY